MVKREQIQNWQSCRCTSALVYINDNGSDEGFVECLDRGFFLLVILAEGMYFLLEVSEGRFVDCLS